ncbi:helix-turn-helix domain-containing protein [Fischerella sp. PCC 9605]|uniref:helix-turn-helix domain-containing protein n=1 Tax=Fischerella sp. PCC 9605 TaxID=1173024 RepID=UPI0006868B16|nr:helix-turn-helix transcriptional regulator [Fischerella sp. PCC 9605]
MRYGFKSQITSRKLLVINQPEVGRLIRELRLLTGLTQEQFAATLGVTYPTINRWENGRAKPSPLAMQKIEAQLQEIGEQGKNLLVKYLMN